jgi:ribosomal protein S18 acetylase RimI-like enzyme
MYALAERPYAASDREALLELLLLCRTVGDLDPWPPLRELRRALSAAPEPGARAETRVWEDVNGAILAFASLWDGEILLYCMHPRVQSDHLFGEMLVWGQARAKQQAVRDGINATLCVSLRADNSRDRFVLEQQGFVPEAWWTLRMARRLDSALPAAAVPDGFCIRPLAGEGELPALVELHQSVFTTMSARDERLALMHDPAYRPELDLVAVAPDGALTGFCTCSLSTAEDQRQGRREGWVELLGTQRNWRRCGLGRALLLCGLKQLRSNDVDVALLGVTSWNTAAQQLYRSTGFQVSYPVRWYIWEADVLGDAEWLLNTWRRGHIRTATDAAIERV